ncbi:MAG: homoserine kinase [Gemmatimonadales bacterium]|nr:homoserine kinase [Gemmatimonadales bacterium]NIN10652.1 homoserine kinase [Gemmatimonadales bacterium]NIN49414.1 homoserine kinase [Gemmatimonadales bacterium]NIP06878.1 homoserine kinase [Gemmatimonadales bacterium]NIR01552.1 homoserine kinase [Gemmatimonadales bacterium]
MIGVRVPATTSNLGAGFDCLGLALDLWLEVQLEEGSGAPEYVGAVESLSPSEDIVLRAVGDALPTQHHLVVRSDIPMARGLGSSAAAAVAGFALRQLIQSNAVDRDVVYESAVELEGHPDNAGAATYGGFVLAAPRPARLAFSKRLAVALAVPEAPIDTYTARSILPQEVSRAATIAQTSRAAALVLGLMNAEGDLIAFGMDDQIAVPHRKRLIPGFDEAVAAGTGAGAFGVTISGSGSALLAIAPLESAQEIAAAMASALTTQGNPATPLTPAVSPQGVAVME